MLETLCVTEPEQKGRQIDRLGLRTLELRTLNPELITDVDYHRHECPGRSQVIANLILEHVPTNHRLLQNCHFCNSH
jgi:hypothetical protein